MFRPKRVSIKLGDILVENMPPNKKILAALGIKGNSADIKFQTFWKVISFCDFDGLQHAKLEMRGSDVKRIIALDTLEWPSNYHKTNKQTFDG